jgi:hypothetical protein
MGSLSSARREAEYHVYLVELSRELCEKRGCVGVGGRPPVYVGHTADTPEERFSEHRRGYGSSRWVRDYGVRLRPRLYRNYGPYRTRAEAEVAEVRLADRLRRRGYCVFGGH